MMFAAALLCTVTACSGKTDNEPAPSASAAPTAEAAGTAATATVTEVTGNAAEIEFRNTLTDYGDESHTAIVVNHMKAAQEEQLR